MQPPYNSPAITKHAWDPQRALARIREHKDLPCALLPVLHALMEDFGYIHEAAIPLVAAELNLSKAEVHGVISFYHDFRRDPPGHHSLQICRAEACQSMGCDKLIEHVENRLATKLGETTPDRQYSLSPVFCLGNCALSPAVMLDGQLHGGVTPESIDALLTAPPASVALASGGKGIRVFIPCDAAALSVGAETVAHAIHLAATQRNLDIEIVRNGTRGMLWLEPLVEVETPSGRMAYGPVTPADVPSLFDANFLEGHQHPLALGLTEEIPWLKKQERLTFARCGITDPLSLADYQANGGLRGLARALELQPAEIVAAVIDSGLRGRGGAGFPTGIKWRTVLNAPADQKFIVCNADEGDSGTFADRILMEGDPFLLLEGMAIAGRAVGATLGYIYLRSEYPHAHHTLQRAIEIARAENLLGPTFDIEVRLGAGAYICGEETSLLESLEGKRGQVRPKPPLPAIEGLFGKPTVVNNVLSLAAVPLILERGAAFYRDYGTGRSRGTLAIQLAGNIKRGGLVERAFGLTLREAIYDFGGGTASGRPLRAVQVGGPLGAYFPASLLDTPLDYEAFTALKGLLGHGGIVVFDDTADLAHQARFAMEFCAIESCGKCTPCRIGSTRGVEVIDRIIAGEDRTRNLTLLDDLCELMLDGSLCAMGGLTPYPVMSALRHFPEDFEAR
ncbi:MAG TPA: formate dehydrogenase subunit gamma [Bryobacteraceae bacterium]|nr:formate dehydrogenase subunit gamma [Bryobacteraceae bacterium]